MPDRTRLPGACGAKSLCGSFRLFYKELDRDRRLSISSELVNCEKDLSLPFKHVAAAIFLIFFHFHAFTSEEPFILKIKAVGVARFENFPLAAKYENFYPVHPFYGKEIYCSSLPFYKIMETGMFSGNKNPFYAASHNLPSLSTAMRRAFKRLYPYHMASSLYMNTKGRYFDISGEPLTGALSGGLSAAFYSGFDRYKDTGFVDFKAAAASSALMDVSSYIGLSAGSYAADNFFLRFFSSLFGSGFTGFVGDSAVGLGGGALFAVGSSLSLWRIGIRPRL